MIKLISTIVLVLTTFFCHSQINGSGKISTKNYDYKNFDKVYFEDVVGNIEVEIGKTWSVAIAIDDNLESLLQFTENPSEHELKIQFKDNRKNRMYIENTNTTIKITMPEASVIKNTGNSDIIINNIIERYFRLENTGNGNVILSGSTDQLDIEKTGNGNVILSGSTDQLDIEKTGNGDVISEKLLVKKAKVKSTGNGNVVVNVSKELTGKLSGNGDIINKGDAKFDSNSKKSGNGKLIEQ
jgi:Putative auto-transporter adhesin, head GIN domain